MELNIAISIVINYRDISQYQYYRSALVVGIGNGRDVSIYMRRGN